jgi:hypothetical protein
VPHIRESAGLFKALRSAVHAYYEHRVVIARDVQSLGRDQRAAVKFFFDRLKAVYEASRVLAKMNTSSTGNESFQRGVHGGVLEEHVRAEIKAMVHPLHVSTGAVMGAPAKDQLDLIVWDPAFADSVVRVGEYVYVPPRAVRGVLEIKGGVGQVGEVAKRLFEIDAVFQALLSKGSGPANYVQTPPTLGVIIADSGLFDTVLGQGGYTVVSLFQNKGNGDLSENTESYRFLREFVDKALAYTAP